VPGDLTDFHSFVNIYIQRKKKKRILKKQVTGKMSVRNLTWMLQSVL